MNSFVVDLSGELIIFADGLLSGPPELVEMVKVNVATKTRVRLIYPDGQEYSCSLNPQQPFEVVAALSSPYPHKAIVLQAPVEVMETLDVSNENSSYYVGGVSP